MHNHCSLLKGVIYNFFAKNVQAQHLRWIYIHMGSITKSKHTLYVQRLKADWTATGTPPLLSPQDTCFHFTQALMWENSGLLDVNALTEGWRKVKYLWICWYERWRPLHYWWCSFSLTEQTDNSNRLLTGILESQSWCVPWDDVHSYSIHRCITLLWAPSAAGDTEGTCCRSSFFPRVVQFQSRV